MAYIEPAPISVRDLPKKCSSNMGHCELRTIQFMKSGSAINALARAINSNPAERTSSILLFDATAFPFLLLHDIFISTICFLRKII